MTDPPHDAKAIAQVLRDHAVTLPARDGKPLTAEILRSAADVLDELAVYIGTGLGDKVAAWDRYSPGLHRLQRFAQTGLLHTAGRWGDDLIDIAITTIEELHRENASLRAQLASKGKHLRPV